MDDLEERANKAGIHIAVRTNFIDKPANAVANLKVSEFTQLSHQKYLPIYCTQYTLFGALVAVTQVLFQFPFIFSRPY